MLLFMFLTIVNGEGYSFPKATVIITDILLAAPADTDGIHFLFQVLAKFTSEFKLVAVSSPF